MYNSLPKYAYKNPTGIKRGGMQVMGAPLNVYKNPIGITRAGMQVMGAPSSASELTEEEYEKGKEAVMKFSTGSLIFFSVVAFAIYHSEKNRK